MGAFVLAFFNAPPLSYNNLSATCTPVRFWFRRLPIAGNKACHISSLGKINICARVSNADEYATAVYVDMWHDLVAIHHCKVGEGSAKFIATPNREV
jgi:hypothetical protein